MSKKSKKNKNMRTTLKRHSANFDESLGSSLLNDFMQVSQALERLQESDNNAFQILYASILKNLDQEEQIKERGSRISKLQRGQKHHI